MKHRRRRRSSPPLTWKDLEKGLFILLAAVFAILFACCCLLWLAWNWPL
jgi:hypothetical protein